MDANKVKTIPENSNECKGILLRGKRRAFISKKVNLLEFRFGLRPLKSQARNAPKCCPGCPVCQPILEQLEHDWVHLFNFIEFKEEIQQGKLYSAKFVIDEIDTNTGEKLDWHIMIYPLPPEKQDKKENKITDN